MAKNKKMTNAELAALVDSNMSQGVGYYDSKLSREREKVKRYYDGELPLPHHSGNSKYVSMDVYDTVESAKSQILEVFSNDNILAFAPQGADDVAAAKVASLYTEYVINRQNDGFKIREDVITDGLMSRCGVVKVYWDDSYTEEEESFEDVPEEDLMVLVDDADVTIRKLVDNEDGTLSGTLVRRDNTSHVQIDPVPPEEFVISKRAKCLKTAMFVAQKMQMTESELIAAGYDKAKIKKLASDDEQEWETEKVVRFGEISDGGNDRDFDDIGANRTIAVTEAYMYADVNGEDVSQYWMIIKAGDMILKKQQVNDHPFVDFTPLPIPHSRWGSNFAAKAIPIQNARTTLVRGILDHTVITNNPRTIVVRGSLVNPREMLENRIGGIVNVTRPDGIFPYPQSSLNPFVFQTIGLLDEDKEDTTGVSKMSQGLNKEAVSTQNSQGMMEQLVGLSQQRQKIIARNFAKQFLTQLYLKVYKLVIENEDRQRIIDVAGEWVEITPSQWQARTEVTPVLRLGYGEAEKDAQDDLMLHQLLSADPQVAPMYGMQQKHALLSSFMEKKGRKNVDEILLHPSKVQPPPPDPMVVHQMEMEKMDRKLEAQRVQIAQQKMEGEFQFKAMQEDLKKSLAMMENLLDVREQERKEFDSKTRAMTAERELNIVEETKPTEVKQANIISPNS